MILGHFICKSIRTVLSLGMSLGSQEKGNEDSFELVPSQLYMLMCCQICCKNVLISCPRNQPMHALEIIINVVFFFLINTLFTFILFNLRLAVRGGKPCI